jgi:hypothetical protein
MTTCDNDSTALISDLIDESMFIKSWQHDNTDAEVKQVYLATTQEIARSFRGKCFKKYK